MAPSTTFPPVLSIDFVIRELSRLFHPFCALLILLCRLALGYTWGHVDIGLIILASALQLCSTLAMVDGLIAFGPPRRMKWDEEVVVITGGSSGLGRVIADTYRMRGVSVAVLDVRPFFENEEEEEGNVRWYQCDVGNEEHVRKARDKIVKDLGTPTILINNAGIVNGKPLLSLSPGLLQRNFNINLLSHFYTLQAFLPAMLQRKGGGTIVTVSSVLGHLGASHLSDYTAAKAGLMAMHTSLRAELSAMVKSKDCPPGAKTIRTILVTPGQLSTPLFRGVTTPSNFFGPVVEPVDLARMIVAMVDAGKGGVIAQPFYTRWIQWMDVLPYGTQGILRWLSGVDKAMSGFGKLE